VPPLVAVPLPEDDETPDEDDRPEDEEVPEEVDDVPDEGVFDEDTAVDAWAKVAPMPAVATADSRPTCQVILLTRRRPRSLDRRAAATAATAATAAAGRTG
jgi:hypothetical protein